MTTIETPAGPTKAMVLNMGPQHPSTHGVLRVILELDGETVLKAESVIGYLHTAESKRAANRRPILKSSRSQTASTTLLRFPIICATAWLPKG